MKAEAVTAERAAQVSQAKLMLFVQLAGDLEHLLGPQAAHYEEVRSLRDSFTSWAPWTIELPVWSELHEALTNGNGSGRAGVLADLVQTKDALKSVLSGAEAFVPPKLFGNIAEEVRRARSAV